MSNEIDEDLLEQIFGQQIQDKLIQHKLINTTNKEENQKIVKKINKNNNNKFSQMDDFNDWVIQLNDWRINLIEAINLILGFNEDQLDLVWASIEKI